MDSTESRGRRILLQAFAMCIQIILLVALFVFVPSDDGIWFLYSLFLAAVIAASWIFVFSRILNGTFRQGSAADLVIGAIAILLFYTIPAGISLLWLHHSLNPRDSTVNKNSDFADAKISVFTEPGEDRKSMMHRLKRLNEFVYLISATDVALLMFFVLTSTHFLFSASNSIYSKIPIYFLPAPAAALSLLDTYIVGRKITLTAKLLPGKEGVVVRVKKERYLFGYPVCSKVKIGRRKYLAGSNMDLIVNESVFIEKSVYVQGKARVWLLLNVKPSSF